MSRHDVVAEHRPPVRRRVSARVTFSRAQWHPEAGTPGVSILSTRYVRLDGAIVGELYAIEPHEGNPHRPTAWSLRLEGRDPIRCERLEEAREAVERELG